MLMTRSAVTLVPGLHLGTLYRSDDSCVTLDLGGLERAPIPRLSYDN